MSAVICVGAFFFTKQRGQTFPLQGTLPACFGGLYLRRISPAEILMHFGKHLFNVFSEILRQVDVFAASGFKVIERGAVDPAAEHFLQTHRLRRDLQAVAVGDLAFAVLIFHR